MAGDVGSNPTKFSIINKGDLIMSKRNKLIEIDNTYINGNLRDMVKLINEYGLYDFWADYYDFLFTERESELSFKFYTYSEMVKSYHRITYR